MPVPRRFDRRPPERDQTRLNDRIRSPEVRLIGSDGEQVGVVKIEDALERAQAEDLDLVEVAPEAKPPVARLLDYSKYKYEQEQKAKAARKHQQQVNVREIKLRPKIADHDYETKKGHVERFLLGRNKVKVTIMFRGREQAHPERGRALLQRLFEDLDGLATIEQEPLQEGRNMSMLLAPVARGGPGRLGLARRSSAKDPQRPSRRGRDRRSVRAQGPERDLVASVGELQPRPRRAGVPAPAVGAALEAAAGHARGDAEGRGAVAGAARRAGGDPGLRGPAGGRLRGAAGSRTWS